LYFALVLVLNATVAGSPTLHAALKPLEWLLGCWKTTDGFGHYPTIKDFHYMEQIEFFHVGQPNMQFMQVNLFAVLSFCCII